MILKEEEGDPGDLTEFSVRKETHIYFTCCVYLLKKDEMLIYLRFILNKNWKLKLVVIIFTISIIIINS